MAAVVVDPSATSATGERDSLHTEKILKNCNFLLGLVKRERGRKRKRGSLLVDPRERERER